MDPERAPPVGDEPREREGSIGDEGHSERHPLGPLVGAHAIDAREGADELGFEDLVVVRVGAPTLNAEEVLLVERASDSELWTPRLLDAEEAGGHSRPIRDHPSDVVSAVGLDLGRGHGVGIDHGIGSTEGQAVVEGECAAHAGHERRRRAFDVRVLQSRVIAPEELAEGSAAFARPALLAGGELEGDPEADEVDEARSAGRFVEVGEAAT